MAIRHCDAGGRLPQGLSRQPRALKELLLLQLALRLQQLFLRSTLCFRAAGCMRAVGLLHNVLEAPQMMIPLQACSHQGRRIYRVDVVHIEHAKLPPERSIW